MGYRERQAAGRKRRSGSTVDTPFYPAPAQRRLLIVSANSKPATGARGRQRARLLPIGMGTRGYTLLELLISMAILLTVTGAVFEQINQMQKKTAYGNRSSFRADQPNAEEVGRRSHEARSEPGSARISRPD